MASIKYEVLNMEIWKKTENVPTSNTIEQYKTDTIRFGKWARKVYGTKTKEELCEHSKEYIQAYCDELDSKGRAASTIRTYAASLCHAFKHSMSEFNLPARHTYENIRSRGTPDSDRRNDTRREASPKLFDFAEAVGVRRKEYWSLHGNNLKVDESGYLCVEVSKGKGGKYQLQRILPDKVDFVRGYFDGTQGFVFTKEQLKNKIDLHALRAANAKKAYQYYLHRLRYEPGYREQLEYEIEARWKLYRGRMPKGSKHERSWGWDVDTVRGFYHIRGKNKEAAIKNGFDTSFDRCAVMAVSVFHLSHWRCDVAINNYLLAK